MRSIIRLERRDTPFVIIDKTTIRDKNLSWKAKGLHAYLLSLPDDWKFSISELSTHACDARTATGSAMNELIENGYVERRSIKDENGRFSGYEYIVFEVRNTVSGKPDYGEKTTVAESRKTESGKPVYGKPVYGKTDYGKPETTNKECTDKDITEKETTEQSSKEEAKASPQANMVKQENGMCRRIFTEKYEDWKGEDCPWTSKENKNLQELLTAIKGGMSRKGIEITLSSLRDAFTLFIDKVYEMRAHPQHGWYYKNHFTPSGLYSQYSKIINAIYDGKKTERKREFGNLFDQIKG